MKRLSRAEMRKVNGGKPINACNPTQKYVFCSTVLLLYGCETYTCTSGCMDSVPPGCTTDPNTLCVNGVFCG